MPTVQERLQHYYSLPNAKKFGKKKVKALGWSLAGVYDRGTYPPVEYVERLEEGETLTVRNYPGNFKKIIDAFIWRMHKANPVDQTKTIKKIKTPSNGKHKN